MINPTSLSGKAERKNQQPTPTTKEQQNPTGFQEAVTKRVKEVIAEFDVQVDAALDETLNEAGLDDRTKGAIKRAFEEARRKQRPGSA